MKIAEKIDIITRYLQAYNNFDLKAMMETIHPSIEFRNISGDEINASASGWDEFKELAELSKGFFTSRCQKMTRYETDEDEERVTVEIDYEAVPAADFPNGMKAGEPIALKGRSEFFFRDGKIYRLTDYS